jgi:hypothetical protein
VTHDQDLPRPATTESKSDPAAEIQSTAVDPPTVRAFASERKHLELAGDLTRETAQWLAVLSGIHTNPGLEWDTRQAVVAGHVVRLFKLFRVLLQQVIEEREEMHWVTVRLIMETIINLSFLLTDPSADRIRSFILYSLRHEHRLRSLIQAKIAARGGEALPIELRMLRSIERMRANSAITWEEVAEYRERDWGSKNILERSKEVGLDEAYLMIIGGPSRNIHGNWSDFLQHHLEVVRPGRFRAKVKDTAVRPQTLLTVSLLTVPALIEYLLFLNAAGTERYHELLENLEGRIALANDLHEAFVTSRSSSGGASGPQ